jgi:hypothetical protein
MAISTPLALLLLALRPDLTVVIKGKVTLQDGSVLPGAPVQVLCTGHETQTVVTSENGTFEIAPLAAEGCDLQINVHGFRPYTRSLSVPEGSLVEVRLEVESLRQTIDVEAAPVTVRQSGEVSQTINSRSLAGLPANGRSINRFALLNPQVRNASGLAADGGAAQRMSVNGASFRTTSFLLDEGSNYDFSHGNAPPQKISVSAVSEFKAVTNQFGAEYGRTSTGILLTSTRSGSDQFHGEALVFGRPSGIQAAPVASNRHTPNQLLQYGASLGGPLAARTYFFLNYEGTSQDRGAFIQSPLPGVYTGDYQEHLALARIDHNFSDSHTLGVRLNTNRDTNSNPNDRVSGFTQPSAATISATQAVGGQLSDRLVLSPRMVNEFRAAVLDAMPSYSSAVTPSVSIVRPNYSTEGGSAYSWYKIHSLQLAEALSVNLGAHSLRTGADWLRQTVDDFSVAPFGEYRFAPGAPTPGQPPTQYSQTFGSAWIRQGQTLASAWVQDEWKIDPRLTASMGLRYDWQSVTRDSNNWAPRLSLAFNPDREGRTVIRVSAGVFYDPWFLYLSRRLYLLGVHAPTTAITLAPSDPAFPAFPESLAEAPTGLKAVRRDLYIDGDRRLNPYSLQYSLSIQQRLGQDWLVSADVIHAQSVKLFRVRDINAPSAFERTQPGQSRSVAKADATRPYEYYDGVRARVISRMENTGNSVFDALVLRASRRFASRYMIEANYLLNNALNYGLFLGEPNTGIPADWSYPDRLERGPSDYSQRQRFTLQGMASLPWQMQVSVTTILATGLPVNPLTGIDNNGDTYAFDRPVCLGRNSYRAPLQQSVEVSLAKRFRLKGESFLELRAEGFNLTNHGNLVKPNATFGDRTSPLPSFLTPVAGISNSDPARQFQFGMRYMF